MRMPKPPKTSALRMREIGQAELISFGAIEHIAPADLVSDPSNPRIHSEKKLNTLAQALASTRVFVPIIIDVQNVIIAGKARLAAAKILKLRTVPTLRAAGLSKAQLKAFQLADNRFGELGEWDDKKLAASLRELTAMPLDFNIEALGWDYGDIDFKIDSLNDVIDDQNDPADLIPATVGDTVTRPGDVWLCDKHRVICGSALEQRIYEILMKDRKARMGMQDPPFNVSVKKHVGGLGKIQHREFAMASGEMSDSEFETFLIDELRLSADHCEAGSIISVFMDWRGIDKLIRAGKSIGLDLINLCVWNKTNASMGSLYRSKHELVAIFKKPGAPHHNNVQLGKYGRYRTNVWDAAGCNSFGRNRMKDLGSHPTVKPVQLVADAIRDVSQAGEIILDTFLGSGTTMIAAERTGRIAYGIELDPIYVDTAVRRWQDFTGKSAVLESSGRTFAVTAEHRSLVNHVLAPRARIRPVAAA